MIMEGSAQEPFSDVSITISLERVRLDESFGVRVDGLAAGQSVELVANIGWSDGARGRAIFEADETGVVDTTTHAPVTGDYEGVRPMGLIQFARTSDSVELAVNDGTSPVEISACLDGDTIATATATQVRRVEGIEQRPIESDELVGDIYLPPGKGPHPGVLVFGGSGGGIPDHPTVELLTSHGYAVLALAYFQPPETAYANEIESGRNWEVLPTEAVEIPLEYTDTAVEWFAGQEAVRPEPLGVVGGSLGANLALLVASRRDEVNTVVTTATGGIIFQGISSEPGDVGAQFARDGNSLPHIKYRRFSHILEMLWYRIRGRLIELRKWYEGGVDDATEDEIEAATIPVENVGGPILLVSGDDDRLWNATRYGDRLIDRLDRHGYEHPYEHVVCEGAGHALSPPYLPCHDRTEASFMMGLEMSLGGDAQAYADAAIEYWPRVLETLETGLVSDSATRSSG